AARKFFYLLPKVAGSGEILLCLMDRGEHFVCFDVRRIEVARSLHSHMACCGVSTFILANPQIVPIAGVTPQARQASEMSERFGKPFLNEAYSAENRQRFHSIICRYLWSRPRAARGRFGLEKRLATEVEDSQRRLDCGIDQGFR